MFLTNNSENWRISKMKHNLLTKLFIISTLTAGLSACGSSDSSSNEPIDPVTVSGDLTIVLDEDTDIHVFDLLEGVTNPADTPIFTRKFTFLNLDENDEPLYEGPALPQTSIFKSSDEMAVATQLFKDVLVHPATVEENPGESYYSQGVYKFTYILDNGSETLVSRNITVTVNGVEDVVTDITLNQPNGFKAPIGYPVPLKATVLPSNATFPLITWASSDDTIATVDADGSVLGLTEGNATITATSADGKVVASTVAEVITEPTEPVGVDIVLDGEVVSGEVTQISLASTVALSYNLIPVELGFTNPVEWTSSNPEAVSVDATGNLTTLMVGETATITATVADLTYLNQSFDVEVTPHANLFFDADPGFESGVLAPNWAPSWDNEDIVEVRAEAAMDGEYGLYLEKTGKKAKFVSQPIAMRAFDLDTTKFYKLSFFAKNLSGAWAGGPTYLWSNSGSWVASYPKAGVGGNAGTWWGTAASEWTEITMYYNGADLTGLAQGDFRIFLELASGKYYIDNISFEEVDAF